MSTDCCNLIVEQDFEIILQRTQMQCIVFFALSTFELHLFHCGQQADVDQGLSCYIGIDNKCPLPCACRLSCSMLFKACLVSDPDWIAVWLTQEVEAGWLRFVNSDSGPWRTAPSGHVGLIMTENRDMMTYCT